MGEIDRRLEALGYSSDAQKAAFLEVAQSTFSRLRSGKQLPGNAVIAKVRAKLPAVRYEELFEEVPAA